MAPGSRVDWKIVCLRTLGSVVLQNALGKLKTRFESCIEIIGLKPRVATNVGGPAGGHHRFASRFGNAPKEAPQRRSEGTFVQQLWILELQKWSQISRAAPVRP